jgi:hypothetical protein
MTEGSKPLNLKTTIADYAYKGGQIVLSGLSLFFSVPDGKGHEVTLLKGWSLNQSPSEEIQGEMKLEEILTVFTKAMYPLKIMFIKGLIVTTAFFFGGRALSIFPIVPTACYLLSLGTLFMTYNVYLAHQKMQYTFTHFNTEHQSNNLTKQASDAIRIIDSFAQQSLSDMFVLYFLGDNKQTLSFNGYVKEQLGAGKPSIDPYRVTEIFFPAFSLVYKVAQATHAVIETSKNN